MWSPKYGSAVILAACLAAPAAAQVLPEESSNRFDASFGTSREPIFARRDVTALFPAADLMTGVESASVDAPTTTAETTPPAHAPAPVVATAAKLLKELVISPAESAPAPAPPPGESAVAAPVDPPAVPPGAAASGEEPVQAQATGTVTKGPLPPVRTGRRLAVTRAAWYQHSGRTASGERYNPDGLTAAHRSLPLGTRVMVVNQRNGLSVVVRINDRVPKTAKLPVDLSRGSARAIGMTGIATVALYEVE
jgi:rare lipoprotein A (peptidoglycan hydrolase)